MAVDKSSIVLTVLLGIAVFRETANLGLRLLGITAICIGIYLMVQWRPANAEQGTRTRRDWLVFAILAAASCSWRGLSHRQRHSSEHLVARPHDRAAREGFDVGRHQGSAGSGAEDRPAHQLRRIRGSSRRLAASTTAATGSGQRLT